MSCSSILRIRAARGSALILAIVTALVLSVVALGLAYFSSTEDRISGNDKLQKQGFYAAETGLRVAETLLSGGAMANTDAVKNLLIASPPAPTGDQSPSTLNLHDRGYTAKLLVLGGVAYRDQEVQFSASGKEKAFYSLYVRNDLEDARNSATEDGNRRLNVVSVGYIQLPGGARITKILEEQIDASDTGTSSGGQKGSTPGGTNT